MLRIFMSALAMFVPWVVLLLHDNPGGALLALIMQATLIGWIPASLWALRVIKEAHLQKAIDAAEKQESE